MEPSTKVTTEYILTLHVPLDPPQVASDNLQIFNIRPGGWANGLIRGEVIAPGADWLRIMPDGTRRLDVRLSIRTHDDAIIFVAYQGRAAAAPPEVAQRLAAGETLGPDQIYFLTTPTFETDAPAYAWLNQIVAVGKLVSLNRGKDRHVTYDIFKIS